MLDETSDAVWEAQQGDFASLKACFEEDPSP